MFRNFHLVRTDVKPPTELDIDAEQTGNSDEYKTHCPFHSDDTHPSLFVAVHGN